MSQFPPSHLSQGFLPLSIQSLSQRIQEMTAGGVCGKGNFDNSDVRLCDSVCIVSWDVHVISLRKKYTNRITEGNNALSLHIQKTCKLSLTFPSCLPLSWYVNFTFSYKLFSVATLHKLHLTLAQAAKTHAIVVAWTQCLLYYRGEEHF